MKRITFVFECGKRTIDPQIALENPAIVQALQDRDDEHVLELLKTEF
jgi:hypothetical protein